MRKFLVPSPPARHFLKVGGPSDRFVEGRISAIAPPGTHAANDTVLLNASRLFARRFRRNAGA